MKFLEMLPAAPGREVNRWPAGAAFILLLQAQVGVHASRRA